MDMEFWGVEVKAGEPIKCDPGLDKYLHLSQASLGEVKKDKGNDSVLIYVNVDGRKLVLGTLSPEKCAQISYDLVFEKEFELSHNWKNGSVYFCGYKTSAKDEDEDIPSDVFMDSESESDEEAPLKATENGKLVVKKEQPKPSADKAKAKLEPSASKPKAQVSEPNKANKPKVEDEDDDEDEDEDDDESEEDESDDEDMLAVGDDSDDEGDEESSEEDEATPKKDQKGKKRAAEAESKTSISGKKAKLATPAGPKTGVDGKKEGHTATPHPSKQAGKTTPASNDKAKPQTPKSVGQVSCKSCSKKFNSDSALQAHSKAKHSAGK